MARGQSLGKNQVGFSLLELMIVVALVALLANFALPAYRGYLDDAKVSAAIGDIGRLSLAIERYRMANDDELPITLADLGTDIEDPWGNTYLYLDITKETGKGNLRKDKNLNPLNSDYDLYSKGADGETKKPLSPPQSQDDILRANNGAYVGLAADY